ncbi:MAG: glycosyltransferase [archaeon]
MNICIYEWAMHRIGGGQKVFIKMAEALSENHKVELLSLYNVDKKDLEKIYSADLSKVNLIFLFNSKDYKKESYFHTLSAGKVSRISSNYDLFINSNHETVIPQSRKSIIYFHFPERKIYRNARNLADGIILLGYALIKTLYGNHSRSYDLVLCNSEYTKRWLKMLWIINAFVLNPPIDIDRIKRKKLNIILSAGRIAKDKNYSFMISCFKKISEKHRDYEYLICGEGDFSGLKKEAKNFPVRFAGHLESSKLRENYSKSKIFFHAKGYGRNELKEPQEMEHFGMVTAEAMAQGAVPVVFNGGGQKEIVEHKKSGFLFNNPEEAQDFITFLIENEGLREKMSRNAVKKAREYSTKNFQDKFKELCKKICS